MTTEAAPPAEDAVLEQERWNLEPLVDGGGEEAVRALFDETAAEAEKFAAAYRGKVAELDASGLAAAMTTLAELGDRVGRAGSYAALAFSVDTMNPERGALLQEVQERGAAIETTLLFFDLEWTDLDDERAEELLGSPELDFCRHHLRTMRRYRPHLLSEPEEKILTETGVTGRSAFGRLFTELMSAVTVEVPNSDEPVELMVALSNLQSPDRELRAATAEGVTAALDPGLRTRAFIFNTLLQDKSTKDRLRSYPHWLAARNLSNEASDESVEALVEAVVGRYEIARRWYRLKAKLLGLERLAHYDRMAPVAEVEQTIAYADARKLVLECYESSPPSSAPPPPSSSPATTSTRRRRRASAAAPSAPTRSPRATRT